MKKEYMKPETVAVALESEPLMLNASQQTVDIVDDGDGTYDGVFYSGKDTNIFQYDDDTDEE